MFLYILQVILITSVVHGETTGNNTNVVYYNLTDDNVSYTWSTFNPYNRSEAFIVQAEEGYNILVTVTECDIAGDDGDFLLIKSGSSVNSEGNGRIFTYTLSSQRQYLVDSNQVFVSFEMHGENSNRRSGATVVFQRYGDRLTTTESPSTTANWPTPSANDTIFLTVSVYGKADSEYYNNETLTALKTAVSEMAREYCTTNNVPLTDNVTTDNVHINELIQCPYYWPNRELCVTMRFALPVFKNDSYAEWNGYQLNSNHLDIMWNSLSELYLQQYGFSKYHVPDTNYTLLIWSLSIMGIITVFSLFLFILRYLTFSGSSSDRNSGGDTSSLDSQKRGSNLSLTPHPLQSTPSLFENDYPMYEPGFMSPPYVADNLAFSDDDSDVEVNTVHFTKLQSDDPARESET